MHRLWIVCRHLPGGIEMNDAVARVLVESVPEDALDTCREAADNCPVEAVKIEE